MGSQGVHKAGEGFSPGAIWTVSGLAAKPQLPCYLLHGVFKQRMEKEAGGLGFTLLHWLTLWTP